LRAAEWFEVIGDTRRAARPILAGRPVDRALSPVQVQVMTDVLQDPVMPVRLDLSLVDPSQLADTPEQLLALAADQLLSGDTARGGEYLDLLKQTRPSIPPKSRLAARFAAMHSFRYALAGQPDKAVHEALAARAIQEQTQLNDEWDTIVPLILMRAYTLLEDPQAVAREAAMALAIPDITEPVKLVMVPGALALASFQSGQLAKADEAARAADADARRLGFGEHFFAIDHLRTLTGLALERRDLGTAEHLNERALSVTEQHWPALEFLTLLDRAQIRAARGRVRDALATVESARQVLAGTGSVLLARADELEALLRLSLGDLRSPAELATSLPGAHRGLLLARITLAAADHRAAQEHLQALSPGNLAPRHALERQILLAATAIGRGDPTAGNVLGGALHTARHQGFLNTVVTTAPQVTSYLIEHTAQLRPDPFIGRLTAAARQVRVNQPSAVQPCHVLAGPLTATEQRILELLPTSTYLQIADALYVSRNTVKTHLRSIYQKLGATSRSQALQRAADLRLI
jgi:LuxR family maltose regulon positive regulatory protein